MAAIAEGIEKRLAVELTISIGLHDVVIEAFEMKSDSINIYG